MGNFTVKLKGVRLTGKNIIALGITIVLLIVSIIVALMGFTTPGTVSQTSTLVSYSLQGSFSEQVFGYPPEKDSCPTCPDDLIYFPKVIGSTTGSYTYEFLSDETVSNVKTTVQISAVVTRTGYWSKTLVLVPSQTLTKKTITFPIDTNEYLELAKTISEELGLGAPSAIDISLIASVNTEATVGGVVVKDNLTQTCELTASATVMNWSEPLDLSRKGYQLNKAYEQRGSFGYTITLIQNSLYEQTVLKSPTAPVPVLRQLNAAANYKSDVIDRMNVSFTYNVVADNPFTDISNVVKADAILSNPDGNQVVFPLLDSKEFSGDLTVNLPIDVALLYDIIKKMENTTENDFDIAYSLVVKVNVGSTASSPGAIRETISAILPVTLTADNFSIGAVTDNTKTGTITSTTQVENKTRSSLLLAALSLWCLTLLAALWLVYQYMEKQRARSIVHELWESTQETANSHKDVIVDVVELPPSSETDRVSQINSLPELVKLSDSLLKPVLHQKEGDKHTYCVIDGVTRYVFIIIEPPPRGSEKLQDSPQEEA
jgi:hypothetical protein